VLDLDFVIVTAGALPEAYFLAAFLALHAQRLAIVNVVRPAASRLPALARLRRTRGLVTRLRAQHNYARLLRSASLTLTPKDA
jgi:hypothetical protein